jgi:hypothetical protein
MKKILAVLITLFLLNSAAVYAQICYPGRFSEVPLFDSADIRKDSNIVYATSKNVFTNVMQQLQMDVYYPDPNVDTMQNRPLIVLMHGGAFLGGNRNDMAFQCMEYARRGFVCATISYRLGWNCAGTDFFNVCVWCQGQAPDLKTATYCAAQDGRAAMRYVNANCATWNADANRLFIGGESAGSITAYHTTFWDQTEANAFAPWAVGVAGALDTAGNSLPNTWHVNALIDNCGAISKDSALLNNGNIPVISFHDELDCAVPNGYGQVISCFCSAFYYAAGSSAATNLLSANGVCTEKNTVMGNLAHCSYPPASIVKRASCFMKRVLCNACVTATNTDIWAIDSCDNVMTGIAVFGLDPVAVTVVPNPASDVCAFRFSEPARHSGVLRIYDAYGRLICAQPYFPMTTEVRVETGAFAEGSYFAETELAGQLTKTRFTVVH